MAITHTRLLQFYQNFGKFYTWQFAPSATSSSTA